MNDPQKKYRLLLSYEVQKLEKIHSVVAKTGPKNLYILQFQSFCVVFFCFQKCLFENIFDFTTAGEWDCVAAAEHYSVVWFCFSCPLDSYSPLWSFKPIRGLLMMSK